ncbi:hypothetical protein [Duganella aceris]|uniref:Uncharacterized protein n=1 Tax=Duganella aceris TaxID=2703883 RepID=A0ABX0FP52_9BURK|nr:hypothetical protein [Duganella aceris]NGZ86411.1 hypothetical protein [Duganella aceris]
MTDATKPKKEAPVPSAAVPVVQHAEPQRGGSYTRNLDTGELEQVPAEPAAPISQE